MTQAYFLVAHGSAWPQSELELNRLADYLRELLVGDEAAQVRTGCLEFASKPLASQLIEFQESLPSSCRKIQILPVFLLPGNHVRSDIPEEIQIAQGQLNAANVQLSLNSHLGSHPALKQILLSKMAAANVEAWILVGHGSRRSAGNRAIEQLARHLMARPAFWANTPTLSEQVDALIQEGIQSIGIVPYFLFSGKITGAIATQVMEMSRQYPHVTLQMLSPLEPSSDLAAALLDLTQSPSIELPINSPINRSLSVASD